MSTEPTPPLSPRHERFVLEFLKDGNATQAYVRAGYSPRGAQPSASRLLRDPRIEAAITAGRARMAQALEVDVTRLAQEYARIAFANVVDFLTVEADGRVRVDLMKASQAQCASIVELKVSNHGKQEQTVTLKLGKLQALNMLTKQVGLLVAKPKPGLTPEDRERYEERIAGYERGLDHRDEEKRRWRQELEEVRAALKAAHATIDAANLIRPGPGKPPPESPTESPPAESPPAASPPAEPKAEPQRVVEPGMPTTPPPDYTPGHLNGKMIQRSGPRLGPNWADALRDMKPGGFDPPGCSRQAEDSSEEIAAHIRAALR
ncbi:MAG: terminase small subunit [Alphaproteobacteria bacterium]|nr:terminase small subunit [Alphaproteobacteria bacterium]